MGVGKKTGFSSVKLHTVGAEGKTKSMEKKVLAFNTKKKKKKGINA